MTDGNPVQLVNRGGKIVGIDPETGETVPIKMGEGLGTEEEPIPDESHFEAVRTEEIESNRPAIRADSRSGYQIPTHASRPNQQVQFGRPSQKSLFCWFFDDALLSVYRNQDVFVDKGVKAGIAPATDLVGSTGEYAGGEAMGWDQIRTLADDYGWEIHNHSKTHTEFDQLDEDELAEEVLDSTSEFLDQGINPSYFVYPYNTSGGSLGRGIVSELYPFAFASSGHLDSEMHPLSMNRISSDGNNNSIDDLKNEIDDAIASGTGLVLYGHAIIDGEEGDEGNLETSTQKIEEIIDYVRNNGGEWADNGTEQVIRESSRHPWIVGSHGAHLRYNGNWIDGILGEGTEGLHIQDDDGNTRLIIQRDGSTTINPAEHMNLRFNGGWSDVEVNGDGINVLDEDGNQIMWLFSDDRGIRLAKPLDFNGTYIEDHRQGTASSDPTADSPDGYLQIEDQSGNDRYVPFYD